MTSPSALLGRLFGRRFARQSRPAAAGALVIDPDRQGLRRSLRAPLGIQTNNFAEYQGLIKGLEAALACGARNVEVRMDSELLVNQALGRYRVKHPGLIPLVDPRQRAEAPVRHRHLQARPPRVQQAGRRARQPRPRRPQVISAIILAAGESSRMGQLKQLLPWAGTTLLDWQVREARVGRR